MKDIESQYIWVVDSETGFRGEVLLDDYLNYLKEGKPKAWDEEESKWQNFRTFGKPCAFAISWVAWQSAGLIPNGVAINPSEQAQADGIGQTAENSSVREINEPRRYRSCNYKDQKKGLGLGSGLLKKVATASMALQRAASSKKNKKNDDEQQENNDDHAEL